MSPFKRILVATDFSDDARAALDAALELGAQLGAEVHLFHSYRMPVETFSPYGVPLPDSVMPELRRAAGEQLAAELVRVRDAGLGGEIRLVEGPPAEGIAEAAAEIGADLVVMGTRGRTGLSHWVLGSVAERTVRLAPCPVLTVKAKGP